MSIKQDIKKILAKKRGQRFRYAHLYLKKRWGEHFWVKIILVVVSLITFLLGLIMLVTPGPGLLFIAISLLCIAVISFSVARSLDKLEVYLHGKYQKMRDHPTAKQKSKSKGKKNGKNKQSKRTGSS